MRIIIFLSTILLIADLIADTAIAQQTRIPLGLAEQPAQNVPLRGMSKQLVSSQFGQPNSTSAAVGEPPISIWHYPKFSVYFETDTVIHSVQIIEL